MKTDKSNVKETAKVAATKVETVPAKESTTVKKTAPAKETASKETPVKAETDKKVPAGKKTAEKKLPVKKAPAKKTAVKETVYLQYLGKEIDKDEVIKKVKEVWTKTLKNKISDISTITIYLKPEENAAYYVVNGEVTGSLEL